MVFICHAAEKFTRFSAKEVANLRVASSPSIVAWSLSSFIRVSMIVRVKYDSYEAEKLP